MSTSETEIRLARCFSALFPELTADEIPRASPASVASWDSLAAINLVAIVEEEFGVEIPPDAVDEMGSFGQIVDYLDRARHRG
jgi:acyl carrier protein